MHPLDQSQSGRKETKDMIKHFVRSLLILALGLCLMRSGGVLAHAPIELPGDGAAPLIVIRPDAPTARTPAAKGRFEEASIPDTCTPDEQARLFIDNYLYNITSMPELDYLPFNRGKFDQVPARLILDVTAYYCALPKYRESLPLLRLMCGSEKGLEIDQAWARNLLQSMGPDGLYYTPLSAVAGNLPKGDEEPVFDGSISGRVLGSLTVNYRVTGDEIWNETARRYVDRMRELAITVNGNAFFPKFRYRPNEKISREETQDAIDRMWDQTTGETARNICLAQTWIIVGLAQYYSASGYEPARELAQGLVNYMQASNYVNEWSSHFHCVSLGIHGLVELAEATGDRKLADLAAQAYEVARSGERSIAMPSIGYFVNERQPGFDFMEGCTVGDMTAIALKLARLGMGDRYWEDVDIYMRNYMVEDQIRYPGQVAPYLAKLAVSDQAKPTPVEFNHLVDQLPERLVGAWNLHFWPNDLFAVTYFDTCCSGNISRALYYAWESILERNGDTLTVNLLLNRASPWADVTSYIPYTGRVEIKAKEPFDAARIRVNYWIDKTQIVCRIDGEERSVSWAGSYLITGPVEAGQTIDLAFPMRERTETVSSWHHSYRATFRGNEVVEMHPQGENAPLFQRAYYRHDQPRFIKSLRFICENEVKY